MRMFYCKFYLIKFYLFTAACFSIENTVFGFPNYYQTVANQQWQPNQYQPNPQPDQRENSGSQKPQHELNEQNEAIVQSPQESNKSVGYYEASARTAHGRRLGRMLDVLGSKHGDVGIALDSIAERFQTLLREARENGNQVTSQQNQGNWGGAAGYSKRAWNAGYSKKPWSSWSPYAGYSKKPWSPWTKKSWSPNAGYSQRPWSAVNAQNSWSPNAGYSKKAWSQNSAYSKKAWSPYSKKAWSPYSGFSKQDWNAAPDYNKQPWMPGSPPSNNNKEGTLNVPEESPGMDVDDFAMDAGVTMPAVTERRTKKARKEKAKQDSNVPLDENKQSETIDTGNLMDFGSETESYTRSGENIDPSFNDYPVPDLTLER